MFSAALILLCAGGLIIYFTFLFLSFSELNAWIGKWEKTRADYQQKLQSMNHQKIVITTNLIPLKKLSNIDGFKPYYLDAKSSLKDTGEILGKLNFRLNKCYLLEPVPEKVSFFEMIILDSITVIKLLINYQCVCLIKIVISFSIKPKLFFAQKQLDELKKLPSVLHDECEQSINSLQKLRSEINEEKLANIFTEDWVNQLNDYENKLKELLPVLSIDTKTLDVDVKLFRETKQACDRFRDNITRMKHKRIILDEKIDDINIKLVTFTQALQKTNWQNEYDSLIKYINQKIDVAIQDRDEREFTAAEIKIVKIGNLLELLDLSLKTHKVMNELSNIQKYSKNPDLISQILQDFRQILNQLQQLPIDDITKIKYKLNKPLLPRDDTTTIKSILNKPILPPSNSFILPPSDSFEKYRVRNAKPRIKIEAQVKNANFNKEPQFIEQVWNPNISDFIIKVNELRTNGQSYLDKYWTEVENIEKTADQTRVKLAASKENLCKIAILNKEDLLNEYDDIYSARDASKGKLSELEGWSYKAQELINRFRMEEEKLKKEIDESLSGLTKLEKRMEMASQIKIEWKCLRMMSEQIRRASYYARNLFDGISSLNSIYEIGKANETINKLVDEANVRYAIFNEKLNRFNELELNITSLKTQLMNKEWKENLNLVENLFGRIDTDIKQAREAEKTEQAEEILGKIDAQVRGFAMDYVVKSKEVIMNKNVFKGDVHAPGGQVNIGTFDHVYANLNNSGNVELAEGLKSLQNAVMASSHIPEEQKREHAAVINQIGEEASKEKPNKTILKFLSDGLLTALKVIPDIAKVVAAVAPLLKF